MSSSPTRNEGVARASAAGWIAIAAVVAAVSFLPWNVWLDDAPAAELTEYLAAVRRWALWLAVLVPAAVLVGRLWGERTDATLERIRGSLVALAPGRFQLAATLSMAALGAILSAVLFRHNPHLVDTVAQLFQAKMFAAGSLSAPAPALGEFFLASHLVEHAGRWFSQYPPGHPALLALGVLLGLPWLVNPLLAAGTVALLFATGTRLFGQGIAKLAVGLYLVSPFALFMSASYMNHVTEGFFLVLALYAAVRLVQGGKGGWAIAMGLALAAAASIRPLEAAAWALALGAWVLLRRGFRPALIAGLACLAGSMPLLAYNTATTGHPLTFGYTLLWGPGHGLGFHTDPWGTPFTPLVSFANTALDFQRLNVVLFDWPFPSLLFLLAAVAAAGRYRHGGILVALFLAAPFAYFFYWHRDDYLGPRFLFASIVPAVLLVAVGIAWADTASGRWRPAFRSVLVTALVIGVAFNLPGRAGLVAGLESEMKLNPGSEARRLGAREALVLVKVGWGSRIIGRLWGWGIGASEVESAYRVVDGCRMQLALDEAQARVAAGQDSAAVGAWLRHRLAEWKAADLPVERGLLPDASVRVDTTRAFAEACAAEVARDRTGFTVYGSLVWRNDPWLREGIVYARSLGPRLDPELGRRYPDRPHYLYAPLTPEPHSPPALIPLDEADAAELPAPGATSGAGE